MEQFGDGMSRLEDILLQNADYMLGEFDSHVCRPLDTLQIIKGTGLRSISVLILGRALETGDDLLEMLMKYERDFFDVTEMSPSILLLGICSWLIFLPLPRFIAMRHFKKFQDECWKKIKKMQLEAEGESLTKVLMDSMEEMSAKQSYKEPISFEENNVKLSTLLLIIAGVGTTSRAMHYILNTMAFRKDIQDKVCSEIRSVLSEDATSRITVEHRHKMPYLRATILECLRAFTVTPLGGIPHASVSDVELPGYGTIPKGTVVLVNSWTLHHDEDFWKDPDVVRPERFLDEDEQLLPPDHPNRKHLLPFGAGPRVCLGEVFAMTRLFLWTAAVIGKFEITPGPGSDEIWLNPNYHNGNYMIYPLPNEVIFCRRK